MDSYTIILIVSVIAGFLMAVSLGANDVSNAMASSVAAKAVTIKQAIFIAAALNFIGAVFLGSAVAGTIAKGIVSPEVFPDSFLFMLGMLAALLSAGLWVLLASFTAFPVSSTHSIVGSLIGFGIVAGHAADIHWGTLGIILIAWLLAPIIGGTISFIVFTTIRSFILFQKRILYHALFWAPFWIGMTADIILLSLIYRTPFGKDLDVPWYISLAMAIAIICLCIGAGLIIRRRFASSHPHKQAEKVEKIFGKMQISTACFMALSQGSNDVANAIGPVAAIIMMIGKIQGTDTDAQIPLWLLIMGGVGIAIGIALLGKNVMTTLGEKITKLNHTRGFSVEFSASTTVLLASNLGLPVSTTHASVGAITGVGIARGIGAIDIRVIAKIFLYWLITIPVSATTCALIYWILQMIFR